MSEPVTLERVYHLLDDIKSQVANVREQLIEMKAWQRGHDTEAPRMEARLLKIETDVVTLKEAYLRAQGAVLMWKVLAGLLAGIATYFGWKISLGVK